MLTKEKQNDRLRAVLPL